MLLFLVIFFYPATAAPRFETTAILRDVLIPVDAAIDSIIYRLRASDPAYDYPLSFDVEDKATVVAIETLNCTRFNSVCQANVILKKRLEVGRFYDFRVLVRNVRGGIGIMDCSFRATNATTPIGEIFPGAPSILMVSENARRNTELGTLVAKGNLNRDKGVILELWGSPQFSLRQRLITERDAEGAIILLGRLDYETKTVHHLNILANDPFTDPETDSRNIASWPLLVAVLDEQDTPPVFVSAPPTTALDPNLKPGDLILEVKAEDGDRGKPRDIRYGLVSEGNPFTPFFSLSEETGELRLLKPLSDIQAISHSNTPILLTVVAEEVRSSPSEPPAQSSTISLALIPPPPTTSIPKFSSPNFTTSLPENSPPGTILKLPTAELIAQPGLLFTLELLNNNGTFDISPSVVEGRSKFMVKVRDNARLDYEANAYVQCEILAQEIRDESNNSARALLLVKLEDVNDNAPRFGKAEWVGEVAELATIGTSVLKVKAADVDGDSEDIVYSLSGEGSEFFEISAKTGVITVRNPAGLDAQVVSNFTFNVEASDQNGKGNVARSAVVINLIDINNQVPEFQKNPYEFIVTPDRKTFTVPAVIKAIDNDTTPPNNEIRYEFMAINENLTLNPLTGELTINPVWNKNEITTLKAIAYDGGVPRLWSETDIRLYPPEPSTRKMLFVVSGKNPNRQEIEAYLSEIVGGKVVVDNIRKYDRNERGVIDVSNGGERNIVETTVTYTPGSVVDFDMIHRILDREHTQVTKVEEIKTSSSSNLWWLLLTLLLLLLLIFLILILCCVLPGCPLYVPPKKRRQVTPDVEKLVVKGEGQGNESKSVQVAEWFGRREAWTPEHNIDVEVDSMKRHEMERGSERGGRKLYKNMQEAPRDQLYIRDGTTDILRLITRGGEQQPRPVTLIPEGYVIDSGKDILMRRFMDQQGHSFQHNTLNRIQSEHELLEASLRQQNALLRQILSERERDLRLETQSLPAGTQTDQNVSTQTELVYLRPPRRQTRSDNDASDGSDEEIRYKKARKRRNIRKANVKRKIRTPIQEESESNENPEKKEEVVQTKTSLLREAKVKSAKSIQKEVLQEISDSLNQTESDEKIEQGGYYSDSLETTPRSETISRRHSENDVQSVDKAEKQLKQSSSQSDIKKAKRSSAASGSRYMEWYNKSTEDKKQDKAKKSKAEKKTAIDMKPAATKVSKRLLSDTQSSARKKVELPTGPGPEHPLIQHSKNRFEVALPKRMDEDVDSGIALTRPAMAQKKSVFTIAYDDMQTRQLPDSVSTTP